MGDERAPLSRDRGESGPSPRRGSRALLAAALLGGILAALYLGASLPDLVLGALGVVSRTFRLVLKALLVIAALPLAFYLVEKLFLARTRK